MDEGCWHSGEWRWWYCSTVRTVTGKCLVGCSAPPAWRAVGDDLSRIAVWLWFFAPSRFSRGFPLDHIQTDKKARWLDSGLAIHSDCRQDHQ